MNRFIVASSVVATLQIVSAAGASDALLDGIVRQRPHKL
jgi:hypothetical protein